MGFEKEGEGVNCPCLSIRCDKGRKYRLKGRGGRGGGLEGDVLRLFKQLYEHGSFSSFFEIKTT